VIVRFWGVRGSISAPGPQTMRYGGNTPCLEIVGTSGESLIVDAGYGAVGLGNTIMANSRGAKVTVHLILTHLHWDHIQGLPFFAPMYVPGNRLVVHSASEQEARAAMARLFTSIYSPIMGVENLGVSIEYAELGDGCELAGVQVTPIRLQHSVVTLGLKMVEGGRRLVHATDHEGGTAAADARLAEAAADAGLLIHDAQFTADEHARYSGWGHSSTDAAVKNALAARAAKLALFHYDATHSDVDVDAQLEHARTLARGTSLEVVAAAEGLEIDLG
jgi:phosphoribosyl 1,2-cyclic phosphodiesterase